MNEFSDILCKFYIRNLRNNLLQFIQKNHSGISFQYLIHLIPPCHVTFFIPKYIGM